MRMSDWSSDVCSADLVQARVTVDARSKLCRQRRVRRRGEDLEIADGRGDQAVDRAGGHQRSIRRGIVMRVPRLDREAQALERQGGGIYVRDEEADMVQEHLVGRR